MSFIKKEFDNILMVLCFSLAFFMICNIFLWSLDDIGLGGTDYAFAETYMISGALSEDFLDSMADFSRAHGFNCVITDNYLTVGDSYNMFPCDIFLNGSDIPSRNGVDLLEWANNNNAVYLGNGFRGFIREEKNLKTIGIHGLDYSVLGFLPQKDLEDKRVYLLWSNMDSYHRNAYLSKLTSQKNYYAKFESNSDIDSDTILDFLGKDVIRLKKTNSNSDLFSFQKKMIRTISITLLVFLVIASAMITDLWMERRKRQYLVCRVFGYNKGKLFLLIVREIGLLSVMAFFLGWIIEWIYACIIVGMYLDWKKAFWTITISFLASVVLQFMVMVIPVSRILHTYPTQGNIDSI